MHTYFEDERLRMKLEFCRGAVFVHCKFLRFSPTAMRFLRDSLWPQMKKFIAAMGYQKVFALFREDRKRERFVARFGFTEVGRREGWVFVKQELVHA